jgi:uncharacterized protein YutE (UPF0331/DUF86 family)/predicted nucleotidyltransferase
MDSSLSPTLARLVARAVGDPDVLAVMLFGSHARGDATTVSDVDVCLVAPTAPSNEDATRIRLDYLSAFDLDIAVFDQVPLYVRTRILKEGRVLFVRDEDALYALAIRTVRAWEDFRHIHRLYLEESPVVDRDRVLAKLDELDGYLRELRSVTPDRLDDYQRVETKRACERLIQISVETVLDVCALLVTGLRLGIPAEEDDLFEKLSRHRVVSATIAETLRRMKGLRNLLVHEYGRISDAVVFETISQRLDDFGAFTREVLSFLRGPQA